VYIPIDLVSTRPMEIRDAVDKYRLLGSTNTTFCKSQNLIQ
jgi:hypothetical protein